MTRESTPAFAVLRTYLRARASFSDEEMDFVRTMFRPATLRSGEFLQRAGTVAKEAAFVARGCLRTYVIDSKGKEHVVQFAPETWWVADNVSLTSGKPSEYFIDAIEDSDMLLIDSPSHEAVVEKIPGIRQCAPQGTATPLGGQGRAHRQLDQRIGARPLSAIPRDLSVSGDARAAMDGGVVPRRHARDGQPDPQKARPQVASPAHSSDH